jgi:transcriptional regulator with XRE-family HTH domain
MKPYAPPGAPLLLCLFAANLRRYRAAMQLSQQALATRAGLSIGHISMLERGLREPSFSVVGHLAAALNVKDPRAMFKGKIGGNSK